MEALSKILFATKKKLKNSIFDEIDEKLYNRFKLTRQNNIPINTQISMEKEYLIVIKHNF